MAGNSLAFALCFVSGLVQAEGQQPPPERKPQLSERQADRISERQRMIACDRQAREAKLSTAKRHAFIRECIKGDTAAAGDGAKK